MDERFLRMAGELGPWVVRAMKLALRQCKAEGKGFRACKELADLSRMSSAMALDDACHAVVEGEDSFSVAAVRAAMGGDA